MKYSSILRNGQRKKTQLVSFSGNYLKNLEKNCKKINNIA